MAPTSNRVFVFIAGNKGSLLASAADAAAAARLLSGHLLYPLSHWHSLIEIAEGGAHVFYKPCHAGACAAHCCGTVQAATWAFYAQCSVAVAIQTPMSAAWPALCLIH